MIMITPASRNSPSKAEMTAATIRMITMISLNWAKKIDQGLLTPVSTSSLGPYVSWRFCTSAADSPVSDIHAEFSRDLFAF